VQNKVLSNNEIVDLAIEKLGAKDDSDLANKVGCSKQSIHQFRKANGGQVAHKLLSAILNDSIN
jgi:DNA-binding Xre family transcriptional regulator